MPNGISYDWRSLPHQLSDIVVRVRRNDPWSVFREGPEASIEGRLSSVKEENDSVLVDFHLNKLQLFSNSKFFRDRIDRSANQTSSLVVQLDDRFPGGSWIFEQIADYMYGQLPPLAPHNALLLLHVAKYLGMDDTCLTKRGKGRKCTLTSPQFKPAFNSDLEMGSDDVASSAPWTSNHFDLTPNQAELRRTGLSQSYNLSPKTKAIDLDANEVGVPEPDHGLDSLSSDEVVHFASLVEYVSDHIHRFMFLSLESCLSYLRGLEVSLGSVDRTAILDAVRVVDEDKIVEAVWAFFASEMCCACESARISPRRQICPYLLFLSSVLSLSPALSSLILSRVPPSQRANFVVHGNYQSLQEEEREESGNEKRLLWPSALLAKEDDGKREEKGEEGEYRKERRKGEWERAKVLFEFLLNLIVEDAQEEGEGITARFESLENISRIPEVQAKANVDDEGERLENMNLEDSPGKGVSANEGSPLLASASSAGTLQTSFVATPSHISAVLHSLVEVSEKYATASDRTVVEWVKRLETLLASDLHNVEAEDLKQLRISTVANVFYRYQQLLQKIRIINPSLFSEEGRKLWKFDASNINDDIPSLLRYTSHIASLADERLKKIVVPSACSPKDVGESSEIIYKGAVSQEPGPSPRARIGNLRNEGLSHEGVLIVVKIATMFSREDREECDTLYEVIAALVEMSENTGEVPDNTTTWDAAANSVRFEMFDALYLLLDCTKLAWKNLEHAATHFPPDWSKFQQFGRFVPQLAKELTVRYKQLSLKVPPQELQEEFSPSPSDDCVQKGICPDSMNKRELSAEDLLQQLKGVEIPCEEEGLKGGISSEYSGKTDELMRLWVVNDFCLKLKSEIIHSEVFTFGGCLWRLTLYPKGLDRVKNSLLLPSNNPVINPSHSLSSSSSSSSSSLSPFLSVSLDSLSEDCQLKVFFRFSVVNQGDLERTLVKYESSSLFRGRMSHVVQQFVSMNEISNSQNDLLFKDTVIIKLEYSVNSGDDRFSRIFKTLDPFTGSGDFMFWVINDFAKKLKAEEIISDTFELVNKFWYFCLRPSHKGFVRLYLHHSLIPPSPENTYKNEEKSGEGERTSGEKGEDVISRGETGGREERADGGGENEKEESALSRLLKENSEQIQFRISVLNQKDPRKHLSRETFAIVTSKGWGWPKFTSITSLLGADSGFLEGDALVVRLEILCVKKRIHS